MKQILFIFGTVLFVQILSGCQDQSTSPESLADLHLTFVSGSIGANLMPSVPPDPISCQITIVAENSSTSRTLSTLTASQADVFLHSSNEKLGTITFTSNWDGRLGPAERDTVYLTKVIGRTTLFNPQCGKYVYLNVMVKNSSGNSIIQKTDSIYFGCVH